MTDKPDGLKSLPCNAGRGGPDSFEAMWAQVSGSVLRYCSRAMRNPADAEELFQRVMIRVWRGFATFRGDSAPATWVLRIAARESARMGGQIAVRRHREVVLDERGERVAAPSPTPGDGVHDRLPTIVARAEADGALNAAEARVIAARLGEPKATWAEIGSRLGFTASACAVVHCRAVSRLRVYLFLHHQEALGGRDAIAEAARSAAADPLRPLGPAELEVFHAVVLDGRGYRRRGWQANLRAACGVVIRHLTAPI